MSGSFWDQLESKRNASLSVFHLYIRYSNVLCDENHTDVCSGCCERYFCPFELCSEGKSLFSEPQHYMELHAPTFLAPGKHSPVSLWIGGWMDSTAGINVFDTRTIWWRCQESNIFTWSSSSNPSPQPWLRCSVCRLVLANSSWMGRT
jgi:hypothetical protein